uniref:Uncharacterized protein n=1 Tax=uncultured bacterium A1Q1_fos_2111 TaxID=1256563 RepID=L7W262_9BACT|nr:hypothetical protein [uncultured bacterium A1Q1_fos_2111]
MLRSKEAGTSRVEKNDLIQLVGRVMNEPLLPTAITAFRVALGSSDTPMSPAELSIDAAGVRICTATSATWAETFSIVLSSWAGVLPPTSVPARLTFRATLDPVCQYETPQAASRITTMATGAATAILIVFETLATGIESRSVRVHRRRVGGTSQPKPNGVNKCQ